MAEFGNKNAATGEALDKTMERVLSESLPDALNQLAQRHESFGQVVQYLEDNYIASQRSGKDKLAIENEAKKFVLKGLVSVLKDIEVASLNIDQLLQMQTLAIDSITEDVSLIQSRLQAMKSQQLLTTLEEMKTSGSSAPQGAAAASTHERMAVRTVPVDYHVATSQATKTTAKPVFSDASDALSELETSVATGDGVSGVGSPQPGTAPLSRRRIPIEERLASLESVGKGRS